MKTRHVIFAVGCILLVSLQRFTTVAAEEKAEDKRGAYVGAEGCLCHADPIQAAWKKTKHARAFGLLKLAGQEKNVKCLPCHTTGYGRGGYGAEGVTANLEGVQCEECHGPAEVHTTTMDKTKVNRTPSAAVCARCHQELDIHAM